MFDIERARQSGATDEQINEYLSSTRRFDYRSAKSSGASDQQIQDYLIKTEPVSLVNVKSLENDQQAEEKKSYLSSAKDFIVNSIKKPTEEGLGKFGIGFGKEILKRASQISELGTTIGGTIVESLGGKKITESFQPISPEKLEPTGTAEKIGAGVEKTIEFIAPGSLIQKGTGILRTLLSETSPNIAKWLTATGSAGLESISAGLVSKYQGATNQDAKNAAILAGVLTFPIKVLSEFSKPVAKYIQETAEKKASQALGATTKEMKQLSDKVVPELLKRKTYFLTRGGLEKKAESIADTVGEQIDNAWESLPPNTKVQIAPIINSLEKLKDEAIVVGEGGQRVVMDQAKYKAAQAIQNKFINIASDPEKFVSYPEISAETLRRSKQILDMATVKTGKGFGLGIKDTAIQEANKSGANALRNELANEFPDIAKLNKEFNFWKNVEKVVSETVKRTKAQGTPLGETIAEAGGAVGGFAAGGGLGQAILTATGYKLFKKAITSPAWRMVSAIQRAKIADAIYNGQTETALNIIRGIIPTLREEEK